MGCFAFSGYLLFGCGVWVVVVVADAVRGCGRCLCGHDFCIICGGDWPVDNLEGLCHPYFGAHDEHVLQVPAEIQARLDEEERQLPAAVGNPSMTRCCITRTDDFG